MNELEKKMLDMLIHIADTLATGKTPQVYEIDLLIDEVQNEYL